MSEYIIETVSVDEALKRASKMVTYPIVITFLITFALSFCLSQANVLPGWTICVGFALALILAWLCWSIQITKWRIWAFENVRNVHELKKKAINAKIIWKDDSFWGKTAIEYADDKERLQAIQAKFLKEDIFTDDQTVEGETMVYYSKKAAMTNGLIGIAALAGGVYLFWTNSKPFGSFLVVFGIYGIYTRYKEMKNTAPQITLSSKGIQSAGTDFYSWNEVSDEDVIAVGSKNVTYYLIYNCPGKSVKLDIADFTVDMKQLQHLLETYRGRYEQKNNPQLHH